MIASEAVRWLMILGLGREPESRRADWSREGLFSEDVSSRLEVLPSGEPMASKKCRLGCRDRHLTQPDTNQNDDRSTVTWYGDNWQLADLLNAAGE